MELVIDDEALRSAFKRVADLRFPLEEQRALMLGMGA
jgi:hypothetical protein